MQWLKYLAILAFLLPSQTSAHDFGKGGGAAPVSSINPPTPAITFGYNSLAFGDEFDSLSTIDVNNTLAPGFKWYAQSLVLGSYPTNTLLVFNAASFTMPVAGVLHFSPNTPAGDPYSGGNFYSAGYKADNTFVGTKIDVTKGFYAEARMKYDPTCINATKPMFPAFWMWDGSIMYNSGTNTSFAGTHLSELDIFEAFDATTTWYVDWDWTSLVAQVRNTNYVLSVPSPIDNGFHIYAMRVVPQNKNGGTGYITRYVDNIYQSSADVNYTSTGISAQANTGATTGWMSGIDTSVKGMTVQFQAATGCPIDIDWVRIWQATTQ